MISIFITYFIILCIGLLFFYTIGSFLTYFIGVKSENYYAHLFLSLLAGNVFFVVMVSVLFTHGVTVNLAFVLLLLFFIYFSKKEISFSWTHWWKKEISLLNKTILLELFLLTLGVFLLKYFSVYSETGIPLVPHGDQVFYANCSDYIMKLGYENSSVDYTEIVPAGVSPYHYFEIWQNVGLAFLFSGNSALTLTLVTISLGLIIIVIGFCAIHAHFRKPNLWGKLLCLFGLFMSGLSLELYKIVPFMSSIEVYTRNSFDYPKLISLYLFIIASILFFLRKEKEKAILVLLCLPIVSIASSIGIISGVFSFLVVDRIWKKEYKPILLLAVTFLAIYIFVFYKIINKETGTHVSTNSASMLANFTNPAYLTTCFNVVVGASLQFVLIFIPYVFLFLLLKGKVFNWRYEYWGVLLIYLFSLSGWAILHDKLSSVQVFSNVSVSLFNVVFFVGVIYVFTSLDTTRSYLIAIASIAIIGLNNLAQSFIGYRNQHLQDADYLMEIHRLGKELSPMGAFILSEQDYRQLPFSYVSNFLILGNYLLYSESKTFPMSISPFSITPSKDTLIVGMQEIGKKNTPFYLFVEKQKELGTYSSIEQSQVDFIRLYKINYLIVTKDVVLTPLMQQNVKRIITDKKSGEKFILLN